VPYGCIMRIDLRCKTCLAKLSAKSELAGKFVRCPKCRNPVRVTMAPVVLPQLGNRPGSKPVMAEAIVAEEPVWAEALPDDAGFDVLPDEEPMMATPLEEDAPAETPPPPKPKPKTKSKPSKTTEVAENVDTVEEDKPKKKKKKKKFDAKAETSIPKWMWVAGGLGAALATGGVIFGIILAMRMNTPDGDDIDWQSTILVFLISIPIKLVVLIVSMVLSSALGGGINFGDAKTAIIGAIFLIVIVNFVEMIPGFGIYLTLLVWLVGFMTIFGLDPWEARFLLFINWLINYFIAWAMFSYMMNRIEKDLKMIEEGEEEEKPRKKNNNNGKKRPNKNNDDEDDSFGFNHPERVHDLVTAWVERQPRRGVAVAA
jgi:hypothetical protein